LTEASFPGNPLFDDAPEAENDAPPQDGPPEPTLLGDEAPPPHEAAPDGPGKQTSLLDEESTGAPLVHDPPVPFPVPEDVADLSPEELAPALAAVCFALNRPVYLGEAVAILGRSHADVVTAAEYLAGTLRGGALMLQRHQEELQLVTRPEVAWAVQRALNPEKPGRLSRAALETLAIVAYRQPLTRAGVEAIRGVNCEAVLDSLERRGLIVEVGRQDTPGHPRLFGTTMRFLQVVGLERIEDLPPMPEGLTVPQLPEGDWDATEDGTFEVSGAPVEEGLGALDDAPKEADADTLADADGGQDDPDYSSRP
jgi:segregation and condensation protein B